MLSGKSWKPDAVLRLLLSVFICVFGGSVLSNIALYAGNARRLHPAFFAIEAAAIAFLVAALILVRKPWVLETIMTRMLLMMGFFYAAIVLALWAQHLIGTQPEPSSVLQLIIATLSIQGAGLVFMTLFVREHGIGWTEAFGLSHQSGRALVFGVLAACIFLPVARMLQEASFQLLTRVPHLPIQPEQEVVQTLRHAFVWSERVAMAAATIVLAPLAEEMFFRGILYPVIKQAGFPRLALWGSSLIFALIHWTPVIFLPLLVLALLLTWLYEKTDNLLAPITAHSLFNALNFAMVYVLQQRLS